jgi:hypothetical protein
MERVPEVTKIIRQASRPVAVGTRWRACCCAPRERWDESGARPSGVGRVAVVTVGSGTGGRGIGQNAARTLPCASLSHVLTSGQTSMLPFLILSQVLSALIL